MNYFNAMPGGMSQLSCLPPPHFHALFLKGVVNGGMMGSTPHSPMLQIVVKNVWSETYLELDSIAA
jgi:hypothetical protein